jgi:crotonobetainyl-CoA:carnitine CoA-transferase CaiB-like acyl-CoA transferase
MASSGAGPLAGTSVLELGARTGVSLCGTLLAQLGAEVIFVELPPRVALAEHKLVHRACFAAGKLSLVPKAADASLLRRLVETIDVVLTSSDVDQSVTELSRDWYSGQVVCDITAYGATGPLAGRPDGEWQVQARSGVMQITGFPDGPPMAIDLPLLEFMTGGYSAAAVLAALRTRRLGDSGQHIDMALFDCAFAAISTFLPRVLDGSNPEVKRIGNRHSMATPWNVYRARDGWVQLCSANDLQWQRLTQVIGRPELGGDPRYAKLADRVACNNEVDAIVQAWVGTQDVASCVKALSDATIACGPITRVDGYPREANLEHRRIARRVYDPVSGRELWMPSSPMRMSRTPVQTPDRVPAPDADRAVVTALANRPFFSQPDTEEQPRLPLEGIRVLEIGHYTTAPLGARHLANLGAEVIKIEPPGGEAVRDWPPAHDGLGIFFVYTNAGKRSLELDMNNPADTALLDRLINTADVLIENLKPGALAKRGLTPAVIAKRNPRLVYCAVSGFGHDSLYAERPAFDTVIQAMSGLMDLIRANETPVKSGPSSADLMGAEIAVVAILAALEERDRSGFGQYIDLSMQDIAAWITQTLWNDARPAMPSQVIECRDGPLHLEGVGVVPADVRNLVRNEAAKLAEREGFRAASVHSIAEVVALPQTKARGLWFEVADAEGNRWPLLQSPLRLLGTPPKVDSIMSALGSDRAHYEAEFAGDVAS